MKIQYLEVVTTDVEAVCAAYVAALGTEFGEPVAEFGNARTATLDGGGRIGVRAPMSESETPAVRPYWLVDNIEVSLSAALSAGAELAHPPMDIAGQGTFAIYIHGGVQHGLWQI